MEHKAKRIKKMTDRVVAILKVLFILVYAVLGITIIIPLVFTAIFYKYLFGFRCERTTTCSTMEMFPDLTKKQCDYYSGKYKLDAGIYRNRHNNGDKGLLVFCHGIGCGKDNYLNRIDYFAREGYTVFAYDMTGVCDSQGKGQMGVPQATLDLKRGLEHIKKIDELKDLPIVVYGHSWSGFACCSVLNYGDWGIKAVITGGGFNYSSDISRIYIYKFMGNMDKLVNPYVRIVEFFRFGKVATYGAMDGINKFNKPVLIMHSKDDTTIPYKNSIVAKREHCHNKAAEFYSYLDRGHTISRPVENEDRVKAAFASMPKVRERYKRESYFRHNIDTHYERANLEDIYTLCPEYMGRVSNFYDRALGLVPQESKSDFQKLEEHIMSEQCLSK